MAAPLFSDAERAYNAALAEALERRVEVFLPQRDGDLVPDLIAAGLDIQSAFRKIFEKDLEAIRTCDLLVAVLDGRVVDEGVAVELGYAHAISKPCWALKTDPRSLSRFGDNPMIEMIIGRKFDTLAALLEAVLVVEFDT